MNTDREKLINWIRNIYVSNSRHNYKATVDDTADAVIADMLIDNGVVVRERGEWEECDWVEYDGHSECIHHPKAALCCSRCRNAFKKELLWKKDFCPNCGADMRGNKNV